MNQTLKISERAKAIDESITLKLNAKAVALTDEGREIYNLTAGQLPFRPLTDFTDLIKSELKFLKSYQYSPVKGLPELREKILLYTSETRNIDLNKYDFDCIISNGGKHALSMIMASIIDPGDEVLLLAPYWISYPAMIKLCDGVPVVVTSTIFDNFCPPLEEVEKKITEKTKAIVINSPNNPSGIHYTEAWMKGLADLMKKYPDVFLISDELYFKLFYYDPAPTYFYQYNEELLSRTFIVDGISKVLASTGLRIGSTCAPKGLVSAMANIQGQTASGANSLIQRALSHFDYQLIDEYLEPIKGHLRANASFLCESFRKFGLAHAWYQSSSAFYFILDFSKLPIMDYYQKEYPGQEDLSEIICQDLLGQYGIVIVPGLDFGIKNCARLSIVLEKDPFSVAINKLIQFALGK